MTKHAFFCALVLVFATSSVDIQASDDGKKRAQPKPAPAAGQGVVDGLKVQAFIERTATGIVVRLRSSETERAIDRRVKVAVFTEPPMARMSRVMIPPKQVGAETVHVQLAAGEALDQEIAFDHKLGKRASAFVRILKHQKTKRAKARQARRARAMPLNRLQ